MSGNIQVGQRFRDCTALWNEWTVKRVYQDPLGHPHAVMANVLDLTERRTIACPVLFDRSRFVPVTQDMPPAPPAEERGSAPELCA